MPDITAKELKERIAAGENLYILDVREPAEYEEANINGKLIPLGTLPMKLSEIEDWKNKEIIVYCRSGNRSGQACLMMEMAGFTNTANLVGGMIAWQEKFAK